MKFLAFLSILLLISCTKKQESISTSISKNDIQIKKISSGIIGKDDTIKVYFKKDVSPKSIINQPLTNSPFHFKPETDGTSKWISRKTLTFVPNSDFISKKEYKGILTLSKLFPQYRFKEDTIPLNFYVVGNYVVDHKFEFEPVSLDNPKNIRLFGFIEFNDEVNEIELMESLSFRGINRNKVLWTNDKKKKYYFEVKSFQRTKKEKLLTIELDKEKLALANSKKYGLTIPKLNELKINEIIPKFANGKSRILVNFSDPVQQNENWDAYFEIQPAIDFKTKNLDKQIVIDANFSFGEDYRIIIRKGIRSAWATTLKNEIIEDIKFSDLKPRLLFAHNGVYLPSDNKNQIQFRSINVKNASISITHIFENNMPYFLAQNALEYKKSSTNDYYDYNSNVRYLGEVIHRERLSLSSDKNEWKTSSIDLSSIFEKHPKGLYQISVSFNKSDVIYDSNNPNDDYYNDPNRSGYYYRYGNLKKFIIRSDLAMIAKKTSSEIKVILNNSINNFSVPNAEVSLKTIHNQIIMKQYTNSDGIANFNILDNRNQAFFIEARFNDDYTLIKLNESKWDKTLFATSGIITEEKGTKAYVYTDRGVYRPGDTVFVSLIARNGKNSLPDNHPISVKIKTPQGPTFNDLKVTDGKDGFYSFKFHTNLNSPTGSWRLILDVGSKKIYHNVSVETILPNKFRLSLKTKPKRVIDKNKVKLNVEAKYLFGKPASNLKFELQSMMTHQITSFPEFSGFYFANEGIKLNSYEKTIVKSTLDNNGKYSKIYDIPRVYKNSNSRLSWRLTGYVYEKGGRFTKQEFKRVYSPYTHYVGIKKPDRMWIQSGEEQKLNFIVLDNKGKVTTGKTINYKVYLNDHFWWYDYGSHDNFKQRYKTDSHTKEILTGTIKSENKVSLFEFLPEQGGEYFIELQEAGSGHTAGIFLRAYSWANSDIVAEANILDIKTDKKEYQVGETARLTLNSPTNSKIIYSIEKADQLLNLNTMKSDDGKKTTIEVPITENMTPNVYASIALVQNHDQADNDRPLRLFGIVPIMVSNENSHLNIQVNSKESLEPNKPFEISVKTEPNAYFTVAVVDEGLLSLTNFSTPSPWKHFNQKQMLGVTTYDNYNHIIGRNWSESIKVLKIGGDFARSKMESAEDRKESVQRFKPVSLFKGPIQADENGEAKISFNMPDYVGAVRTMAVVANGNRYGSNDKSIPVKSDVMLLPTMPRFIGPGDVFTIPATVFLENMNYKELNVNVSLEGPLELIGNKSRKVTFSETGEKDIFFQVKAKKEIGKSAIHFTVTSNNYSYKKSTKIEVRPYNSRITDFTDKIVQKNSTVNYTLKTDGLKRSNYHKINITKIPNININHRINYLINYPYGCIEQTTSSAFPQLYLKEIIDKNTKKLREIDNNINACIARIKRFQLSNGAFSYWPGRQYESDWGTSYAGHFLIEAKQKGYSVPQSLLNKWINYQKRAARTQTSANMFQIYRLYLLALAGEAQLSPMNLIKENYFDNLKTTEKWLLAATYQLAGAEDVSQSIIANLDTNVEEYYEFANTYGSHIRDMAIILDMLVSMNQQSKALPLFKSLAETVSSEKWYSTQTLAYALLSIGKYINKYELNDDLIKGTITIDGEKPIEFSTKQNSYSHEFLLDANKNITIRSESNIPLFSQYVWSGIPLRETSKKSSNNLRLSVKYLNENGYQIDPSKMKQGERFYAVYEVSSAFRRKIEEIALNQILPAGWEIENLRLNSSSLPSWFSKYRTGYEEYLDIRDDRITWFFDLPYDAKRNFIVKLNTVTKGNFFLPSARVQAMYNKKFQASTTSKNISIQ